MTPWDFRTMVARGEASSVETLPNGFRCRSVDYPASHSHNAAWLDGGAPPSDVPMAEYGSPPEVSGWHIEPLVVMSHDGPADFPIVTRPPGGLRAAQIEQWGSELPDAELAVLEQLADRQLATARACELTNHVSFAGGVPAAWCELRQIGPMAQIENVVTRSAFRGQGHGTAAVRSALAQAGGAFLVAEADDWPRSWYERLGFRAVGEAWTLTPG